MAFYAVLYYAGLRPAEAVGLRLSDCQPHESGWGTLTLREPRPVSGKQWTDSGKRHGRGGLKAREAATDRPVPIPSVLVTILRAHLKAFGTAEEGGVRLNAGVSIAEVARRVGNSPEVIHRRYHDCIDGHEEAANAKIAKSLAEEGDST